MRVLLASASKRRLVCLQDILDNQELMAQPLYSDEKDIINGKSVEKQVEEICLSKAEAAAIEWSIIKETREKLPDIIIVSDTIVEDPDNYLIPMGQPKNKNQATNMLLRLSGKKHRVWSSTAILIRKKNTYEPLHGEWRYKIWTDHAVVEFKTLIDDDIISLIESNSWEGKAGGYDLAGSASEYTELNQGDELTVLGFSYRAIKELKGILL